MYIIDFININFKLNSCFDELIIVWYKISNIKIFSFFDYLFID